MTLGFEMASQPAAGTVVYDFGQAVSGVVRLRVPSSLMKPGLTVVVQHCEVLNHPPLAPNSDGLCFFGELMNAVATDTYILSSGSNASLYVWLEPEFTVHGFRYAQVTGLPLLSHENVEAVVVGSATKQTGTIRFPDTPLLEKINNATVWSLRSNLQDIPTDCNQRDERLGWMGDAALSVEAALYSFGGPGGIVGM
jgi:alpha-L-rhamnosidase